MERLERFYRIQQLLRARQFVPKQDFLEALEVSPATFKRDLEDLRDRFRAPILYDRELEGYRLDNRIEDGALWQLPGLWFSADDIARRIRVLSMGGRAIEPAHFRTLSTALPNPS